MREIQIWIYTTDSIEVVQTYILNLIKESDEYSGEAKVIIYEPITRSYKKLSGIYDLSKIAVNVLREYYGKDKIRVVVREELEQIPENDYKSEMLDCLNYIVDYLESISGSLEKISAWKPEAKGEKMRAVGGSISVDELFSASMGNEKKGEQW